MPFTSAKDGVKIWFEERGDGDPIILVHEFGGEPASWDEQVAYFSGNYRCITYAARGFNPSEVPDALEMYGQQQATDDVAAVLDHLEIDYAHVVGTSMGSFTSLDFTLTCPERVRTLTLIGNSSGPRDADEQERYRKGWVELEFQSRERSGPQGGVAILERDPAYRSFQQKLPEVWNNYAERLAAQSVTGALKILKTLHWNRRSIWTEAVRLRAIQCPVLLVHGDEDYYLVGETNNYLEHVIPKATRMLFAATGHLVNIEQAARFNELLEQHLQSASQTGE